MGRKQLKVPAQWRPIEEFVDKWLPVTGRISSDLSNRSAVRVSVAGLRQQGTLGHVGLRHTYSGRSCALGWCDRAMPSGQVGNYSNFMSTIHDYLGRDLENGKIPEDKAIDLYEAACYIYLKKPSRGTKSAIASAKRKLLK